MGPQVLPEPRRVRYSGQMTQDGEKKLAAADPDELLARAYAVETPDDSLALYKDWADTYDQHLEEGLKYLSPTAVAAIFAEYVPDKTAQTIDIGCGTGLTGLAATSHGYQDFGWHRHLARHAARSRQEGALPHAHSG